MASSDPKIATEEQWEDLIDKVKDKADLVDVPTIQMTTTDPGEGAPLTDGHFIAVYGGSTQVGTSDIADGAVTTAKFAQNAVNQAVKTADNLAPSADTIAAWRTLLPNNGYYLTWYNTASRFTNQPSQHGFLETIVHNNEVYQRWYTQSTGPKMYRAGNGTGWYGGASTAGTFRTEVYTGLSNSVNTAMIANSAVTSAKIDWTTMGRYSTSEQVVGKWVDGRNVYRKVLTGTTSSDNIQSLTHGISNLYAVISVGGFIVATNGAQPIPRVVPDGEQTYGIGIGDIGPTSITNFQHYASQYKGRPYAIILDYIKTS